jgi:hypothetical protein
MTESRRYPRIPYSGIVFISWRTFDGHRNHVLGRAVDVCEQGIGIELVTRIPVGSFVRVQAYGLNLDGSGTVRRVSRLCACPIEPPKNEEGGGVSPPPPLPDRALR